MARHSEDECAYCERDILPLSYIEGDDDQLYCSIKCADLGEQLSAVQAGRLPGMVELKERQAQLTLDAVPWAAIRHY